MPKRRNETEDEQAPDAKRIAVGSPSEPVKLNHADYTIGWICALPKEQTAAIAMLDQKHTDLLSPANDGNVYTLGSISGHNVVIACLPKGRYGTNSAATIATKMISSFPAIKFGLLVGIGGGIPSKVRLGDVVVSTPIDQYPGVIQWDFGKAEDGGRFRRTGALNSPPNALLKVLAKLESEHEMQEPKIPRFLDEMKEKWPRLYPKYFWNDSLKDPQDRSNEGTANTSTNIAPNKPWMRCPDIHHGLIASGNQVIKDATVRDRLDESVDGNILCIEMEAAGLMNDFPCLVVRGICDYADSGKNKNWQEYAAAVAAAYAKEILSVLQVWAVEHMDSVKDILSNINAELGTIRTAFSEITSRQHTQDHLDFLHWLTPVDYTLQQKDYFSKRQPGTGQWLLNSDIYRDWVDTSQQTLFCPGIPGAGKTILTSIIIHNLFERFHKDTTVGIAYLYCNFRRHDEQKLHDLLISLLKQLAHGQSCLPQNAKTVFDAYKGRQQRLSLDDTKKLLQQITASYSRVFILCDALDECQGSDGCRVNLLAELFLLQENTKANIFATSRFIPEITQTFEACKHIEIRASEEDVQRYVRGQLEGGNIEHLPSLIKNKPALKDEIIRGISDVVDGMFLLAKVFLDTLVDKITIADVREAVAQLPTHIKGAQEDQRLEILNQAYEFAWERINKQKEGFRNIATRVLTWIACAKRPLSTKELQHALAVKIGTDELDEDAIPQIHDMVSFCAGLVTVDEESNVIRLVHYTTQEYFERKKNDWFPNAEAMIAETCISYLSFTTFEESFSLHPNYLHDHDFYKYASGYWGDHARIVGRKLDKMVLEFLMSGAKASNAFYMMLKRFPLKAEHIFSLLQRTPGGSHFSLVSGLHLAVLFALDEAINLLLKNGCDVNGIQGLIVTPLLLAISEGHLRIAEMLLDNGGYIGFITGRSRIYLRAAMEPKNYDQRFVAKLIKTGIDFEANISWYLESAVEHNHGAIVKLLLQIGADIDVAMTDGYTPLHTAVKHQNEAMVKLLLNKGANIEALNRYGEKPLHLATEKTNVAIIDLLLKKGADIDVITANGDIPLHILTAAGYTPLHTAGYTPLHTAVKHQNGAMVKLLLDKGANIEASNCDGKKPLHLATEKTNMAIIDLLLKKGANIEALDMRGRTPLFFAVKCHDRYINDKCDHMHEAVTSMLLKKGANFKAVDNKGCTPL